jgi:Bacterial transcriptional activator domain
VLLLVRALAAAGDQAGALAAFDRYRDRLAAETSLDPTPQAGKIPQHVLEGRPARRQQATSRTGPSPSPRGSVPGHRDPFLGREEECAVIAAAVRGRPWKRRRCAPTAKTVRTDRRNYARRLPLPHGRRPLTCMASVIASGFSEGQSGFGPCFTGSLAPRRLRGGNLRGPGMLGW